MASPRQEILRQTHRPPFMRMRLGRLLTALGPGILAMAGDNDAGGLLSYLATGSRFGVGLFIPLLVAMTLVAVVVQELAARIAIGMGESLPELVRRTAGRGWARLLAVELAIQNWFTLLSEFAGMGIGLSYFGLPIAYGIPLSALAVLLFLKAGSYRSAERIGISLAILNLLLVPAAIFALRHGLPAPAQGTTGSLLLFFSVAMVGNAVAPWMPFFQAEAVRARGLSAEDLPAARTDVALGALAQVAVAAAVLVIAALAPGSAFGAQQVLAHLSSRVGPLVPAILAIGLVDAGLVAALTVGLTTAWTIAETWAGPRRDRLSDPLVQRIYLVCLTSAAAVAWIPGAPLALLAVGAQVVSALLMPPLLLALLQLANLPAMGKLRNTRLGNALGAGAILIFTAAALSLCFNT